MPPLNPRTLKKVLPMPEFQEGFRARVNEYLALGFLFGSAVVLAKQEVGLYVPPDWRIE